MPRIVLVRPAFVTVMVLSLVGLPGCTTLDSLRFWEDSEAERLASGGSELGMTGETVGKDGFAVEIPVVVAADRKSASIEIDGTTQTLLWTGEAQSCPCRGYINESYALQVSFPGSRDDGSAIIERLTAGTEPTMVEGVIDEDDGLEIRVLIIVADDRKSVSFHDQGEAEVLQWDGKETTGCNCRYFVSEGFEATVFFPDEQSEGSARVKRKGPSS